MKRYLTYVTLFACIIAVLLATGEVIVRHYPNSYQYKREWMDHNASQVKTLVLGGSHTYYGIIPSELADSTFSLANVTQHPEYDYWLLQHYIDSCTHLSTVILPVDETNLFEEALADGAEWFRCAYYNIYMGCDLNGNNPIYNLEIANLPTFNRKFKAALDYVITGQATLDCDSLGFGNGFTTQNSLKGISMLANATKKANRHQGIDSTFIAHNVNYLDKIVALCHERDIRVIMVTPPMWKNYTDKVDPQRFATLQAIVDKFVSKYGVEYYNSLNDARFENLDFHDPDHLSVQGAHKYTAIVKGILNK